MSLRDDVIESIEIAMADLRPIGQPRDLSQLAELLLDAKDAETDEQLHGIASQVASLRAFCEGRKQSGAGHRFGR
jgi:hypothetical protein